MKMPISYTDSITATLKSYNECGSELATLLGAIAPLTIENIALTKVEDNIYSSVWQSNVNQPFAGFTYTTATDEEAPSLDEDISPFQMVNRGFVIPFANSGFYQMKGSREEDLTINRNPLKVIYIHSLSERIELTIGKNEKALKNAVKYEWDFDGTGTYTKTTTAPTIIVTIYGTDIDPNYGYLGFAENSTNRRKDFNIKVTLKNAKGEPCGIGKVKIRAMLNAEQTGGSLADFKVSANLKAEYDYTQTYPANFTSMPPEPNRDPIIVAMLDKKSILGKYDEVKNNRIIYSDTYPTSPPPLAYVLTKVIMNNKQISSVPIYGVVMLDNSYKWDKQELDFLAQHETNHILKQFSSFGSTLFGETYSYVFAKYWDGWKDSSQKDYVALNMANIAVIGGPLQTPPTSEGRETLREYLGFAELDNQVNDLVSDSKAPDNKKVSYQFMSGYLLKNLKKAYDSAISKDKDKGCPGILNFRLNNQNVFSGTMRSQIIQFLKRDIYNKIPKEWDDIKNENIANKSLYYIPQPPQN